MKTRTPCSHSPHPVVIAAGTISNGGMRGTRKCFHPDPTVRQQTVLGCSPCFVSSRDPVITPVLSQFVIGKWLTVVMAWHFDFRSLCEIPCRTKLPRLTQNPRSDPISILLLPYTSPARVNSGPCRVQNWLNTAPLRGVAITKNGSRGSKKCSVYLAPSV